LNPIVAIVAVFGCAARWRLWGGAKKKEEYIYLQSASDAAIATVATRGPLLPATIATIAQKRRKCVGCGCDDRRDDTVLGCDDPRR
jgi:hypothetical protein